MIFATETTMFAKILKGTTIVEVKEEKKGIYVEKCRNYTLYY